MLSIPTIFVLVAFVMVLIDLIVSRGTAAASRGWWVVFLICLALLWPFLPLVR